MSEGQNRRTLQNKHLLPGGVPPALPVGNYVTSGLGGTCWDQLGRRYIDYICGYGCLILGHCNVEVNQAVINQLKQGVMFPSGSYLHERLAIVLTGIFPHTDRALFLKTGSEAVSAAIRLARAFTGKKKVIRCGFHGWHETVISPHIAWHRYEPNIIPPRIVRGVLRPDEPHLLLWDGTDLQILGDLFRRNKDDVAAFIIDPVQLREPFGDNLREIRELTRQSGSLLILDEAKTGFRVSLDGVQGLYEVKPDLTILSKAISNGFPLSVVLGSTEVVDLSSQVKIMGTYNNELVAIAAALQTIAILERPGNLAALWNIGDQLISGINEILGNYGLISDIRAVPYRWPCMPYVWFRRDFAATNQFKPKFYELLAERGVLLLPDHMNFSCLAHNNQDVENTLQIIDDVIKYLRTSELK